MLSLLTVWVVANEEWVEKLQHQFKFHSDSISLPPCGRSLELGEAVVGKMDGVWVRCRVVGVKEDVGTVTVRTLDTGAIFTDQVSNMKIMSRSLNDKKGFAFCLRLCGIKPAGGRKWSLRATEFLKEQRDKLPNHGHQ